jgi:hypothetical protein
MYRVSQTLYFLLGGPDVMLFFNRVSKKHNYKNKHKPIKTTQSFTFLQVGQALQNKVCMLCLLAYLKKLNKNYGKYVKSSSRISMNLEIPLVNFDRKCWLEMEFSKV